ncbi:MAG TPA: DEAD/DEAH box helicase [Stellaceae bacterium]
MNFSDLGLSAEVLQAVTDAGYITPTPIQEQAIPYVLTGRDVLGCAQTGTGKTAGFTLPMIDMLASGRARARMPRSLIIEPTRELAAQVAAAFDTYGKHHKLSQALLIGGESFSDQERKLDRGVDVLIATPGRLIDLYERGKIILSDTKILVIDEADRMLDMGFIPDVERIVSLLPRIRQTLFFSATMPPEIRRLADAFLLNPKEVTVAPPASPAATVVQSLVMVNQLDKREALRRLLRGEDVKNALIFCNRKRDVDILYRSLAKHGFNAAALHGDMTQSIRTETLEKFKDGRVQLLVASDVAARGLDIQGLSHVFNFDVPIHAEDYVHRIGRTGRAGRAGKSFTFATPDDGHFVANIVALIGRAIPPFTMEGMDTPTIEEGAPDKRRSRGGSRGRGRDGQRAAAPPRPAKPREAPPPRASERHGPPPTRIEQPAAHRPVPVSMDRFPLAGDGKVTPLPQRRPEPHYADDDRQVVGFGDHPPAFLARPRAKLA